MTQAGKNSRAQQNPPVRDTRVAAALALNAVMQEGQSLTQALAEQMPLIAPRDTGLLQELCFGVARYAPAYDALSKTVLSTPIKRKESAVKALLYIGFYQLQHTRIPDHAAINSVIEACKKLKKPWATGLLNGVLRRFAREQQGINDKLNGNVAYRYAHPQWLIEQIRKAWPNDWQNILDGNNAHPPLTLRINARQTTRDAYSQTLDNELYNTPSSKEQNSHPASTDSKNADKESPASDSTDSGHTLCEHSADGITLHHAQDVTQLPGYSEGLFAVQDEAAQLCAELLDLKAQQRVLDACCAPGGKTCHLLEREPKLASLQAIDVEETRMQRVSDNLARLQLQDTKEQVTLTVADAADTAKWWNGQTFDRILLDAPCSATGVIRRHPDIKLLRKPTDIPQLAALQQKILQALWPTLKEGGLLLYATCSILPEENERSIKAFLEATSDAQHKPLSHVNWGVERLFGRQLFPQSAGHDGFYYCLLQKHTV